MSELDKYLKECNLVFTDTIDRYTFAMIGFDFDKTNVNYDGSVSLFDLVSSFNKLYLLFKKEYDALPKLNLGKDVEALDFSKFIFDKDIYRVLRLYITKPTITKHENTLLYLREINGKILPYVTNNKNPYDKDYYRDNKSLDHEISQKYLDLFEKYELLLESYNYFKNRFVFGDGTNCLFTLIDDYVHCNLLDGLHKFKISFGSASFNTEYAIDLPINLGENFGLDYDHCKVILDNKEIPRSKEEYDNILANTYINKQYIKERKKHN